jgi:hypothetical protein
MLTFLDWLTTWWAPLVTWLWTGVAFLLLYAVPTHERQLPGDFPKARRRRPSR